MTVVNRKGMIRLITLMRQGRYFHERPIESECREVMMEYGTDDATNDALEVLFEKICKEK